MGKLNAKVAIVTGAGQGVGRGIALALAKEGVAVAVCSRSAESIAHTKNEIKALGGKVLAVSCDVGRRKEVDAMVAAVVKEYGTVDILINNAQTYREPMPFEATTDDVMDLTLQSGVYGTFYFMQACFPYMKEQGGKIINLASDIGLQGMAGFTAYAATKEAIRGLTRVAANEWGKYKINVNCICPVANSPGMVTWSQNYPEQYQALLAGIPLRRMGDCEQDIGPVVAFLASSDSDYITGHTIMVDGGRTVLR